MKIKDMFALHKLTLVGWLVGLTDGRNVVGWVDDGCVLDCKEIGCKVGFGPLSSWAWLVGVDDCCGKGWGVIMSVSSSKDEGFSDGEACGTDDRTNETTSGWRDGGWTASLVIWVLGEVAICVGLGVDSSSWSMVDGELGGVDISSLGFGVGCVEFKSCDTGPITQGTVTPSKMDGRRDCRMVSTSLLHCSVKLPWKFFIIRTNFSLCFIK